MGTGQFFLTAILIFGTIYGLNTYFGKTLPVKLTETTGTIKPSKILSIFCVVVSSAMLVGGLWLSFSGDDQLIGLICAGMGLFGTIVMLPSVSKFHDVKWDEKGIYGPSGKSFPVFPTRQINIIWEDITKTGEAWSNYQFVEDKNGQRIFWGYWYRGEAELRKVINTKMNLKL